MFYSEARVAFLTEGGGRLKLWVKKAVSQASSAHVKVRGFGYELQRSIDISSSGLHAKIV